MKKRKNSITVHASTDGKINAAIIQPEGKLRAHLVPSAAVNIVEITDHDFHGDLDPGEIMDFHKRFKVDWKRSTGTLYKVDLAK